MQHKMGFDYLYKCVWTLFGAESFIFQFAIQKVKDQDTTYIEL